MRQHNMQKKIFDPPALIAAEQVLFRPRSYTRLKWLSRTPESDRAWARIWSEGETGRGTGMAAREKARSEQARGGSGGGRETWRGRGGRRGGHRARASKRSRVRANNTDCMQNGVYVAVTRDRTSEQCVITRVRRRALPRCAHVCARTRGLTGLESLPCATMDACSKTCNIRKFARERAHTHTCMRHGNTRFMHISMNNDLHLNDVHASHSALHASWW